MEEKTKSSYEDPLVRKIDLGGGEIAECCCHEACYGLILGRYEYDTRCCK